MPSSVVRSFDDPYDFQKSVRAVDAKTVLTAAGQYRADQTLVDLHCLWTHRFRQSLPVAAHFAVHKDRVPISFLADAHQPPFVHSGIEIGPGEIVAASPGDEHYIYFQPNCLLGAASLSPNDYARWGITLLGYEPTARKLSRVLRPAASLVSRLRELHSAAANLAATAPDILSHPEVAKAIEQELIRAIFSCLYDPDAGEGTHLRRAGSLVMRRFEQFLEAREGEPIYLTDVCAEVGVTTRTLRMYCQEHLGMSPHRYLWLRRMNLAQRALARADGTERTVTQIANDHGFGELGRFAVSYRALFGESPSATLRRPPRAERPPEAGPF